MGKDTIDPTYILGGGQFGSGDQVIIAAAARNFGGQVALCAARVNEIVGSKHIRSVGNVLQAGRIEVDGDTVLRDLRGLPLTLSGKEIAGSQANCYATEKSWTDGSNVVEIVLPPYNDRSSNTEQITFGPRSFDQSIAPEPPKAPEQEPEPKPGTWQRSSS